ncbi:MAG: hypothetical protein ABF335_03345 [Alphaproteobacteria bacterium]
MLNRTFTIGALAGAALFSLSASYAVADSSTGPAQIAMVEDLTSPLPTKSKQQAQPAQSANEPGAIEGSLEERYAKFQAEQKKRVEHFHDVVNRNHMKKYGVKVR